MLALIFSLSVLFFVFLSMSYFSFHCFALLISKKYRSGEEVAL